MISDYPSAELLSNISNNVRKNVHKSLQSRIRVEGHEWGVFEDEISRSAAHGFDYIIASDCLWMPWQHQNLAQSMLYFLSAAEEARVFVVAGFHTGRAKMAPFFVTAQEEGLALESIHEEDIEGNRRDWTTERAGEDVTNRRRWLVVAVLKRASSNTVSEKDS